MTIWHRRRREGTKASWMERRGECAIALTCKWSFVTELKFPDPLYPLPKRDFFLPIVWRMKARIQVCVWQEELETKWWILLKILLKMAQTPKWRANGDRFCFVFFVCLLVFNSLFVSVSICIVSVVIIKTERALKELGAAGVCLMSVLDGRTPVPPNRTPVNTPKTHTEAGVCLKAACIRGSGRLVCQLMYVFFSLNVCVSLK